MAEIDNSYYLPEKLRLIIEQRGDLKLLNYLDKSKERSLIKWLLKNGLRIYPHLFKGNFKNNELLNWLSSNSSVSGFERIPRIILGIWDIHPRHKEIWGSLNNRNYLNWLKLNWYNLKIKLPAYSSFFKIKTINNLSLMIFIIEISNSNFFKNIISQINIVNALIFREVKLRLIQKNMGLWGLFIDAITTLIFFIAIRFFLIGNLSNAFLGIDIVIFLSIGVLYVTLFRTTCISSNLRFKQYKSLSFFSQIKPIDIFLALTILEQWIVSALLVIIISIVIVFNYQYFYINDVATVLISFTLLTIFCFSVGLIFNSVMLKFPFFKNTFPILGRIVFFTSCTFFPLRAAPQSLRPFISWNPIAQSIELSRWGIDHNYIINFEEISIIYLFFATLTTLSLSLIVCNQSDNNFIKE